MKYGLSALVLAGCLHRNVYNFEDYSSLRIENMNARSEFVRITTAMEVLGKRKGEEVTLAFGHKDDCVECGYSAGWHDEGIRGRWDDQDSLELSVMCRGEVWTGTYSDNREREYLGVFLAIEEGLLSGESRKRLLEEVREEGREMNYLLGSIYASGSGDYICLEDGTLRLYVHSDKGSFWITDENFGDKSSVFLGKNSGRDRFVFVDKDFVFEVENDGDAIDALRAYQMASPILREIIKK